MFCLRRGRRNRARALARWAAAASGHRARPVHARDFPYAGARRVDRGSRRPVSGRSVRARAAALHRPGRARLRPDRGRRAARLAHRRRSREHALLRQDPRVGSPEPDRRGTTHDRCQTAVRLRVGQLRQTQQRILPPGTHVSHDGAQHAQGPAAAAQQLSVLRRRARPGRRAAVAGLPVLGRRRSGRCGDRPGASRVAPRPDGAGLLLRRAGVL